MSVSLALLLSAGVMIACGVYLMLERTLTRIIIGFVMLGNGVNLLFLVAAGQPGNPPFEGSAPTGSMIDPLPLAMVLTAIVISLGITALGVALAYRAWQLFGHDEVPDDVEDRRVLRRRRRRSGEGEPLPWSQALTEETRRGALMQSQGLDPGNDPLGSDLAGTQDAPQDATEADELEVPVAARRREAPGPAPRRGTGVAGAPAAGPATDGDHRLSDHEPEHDLDDADGEDRA